MKRYIVKRMGGFWIGNTALYFDSLRDAKREAKQYERAYVVEMKWVNVAPGHQRIDEMPLWFYENKKWNKV